MKARDWTQAELAKKARVVPSVLNAQLSGRRPVRDEHLHRYLLALDSVERQKLMAAWLHDSFDPGILDDLLGGTKKKVLKRVAADWSPRLSDDQRQLLDWITVQLVADKELYQILHAICRRLGFRLNV